MGNKGLYSISKESVVGSWCGQLSDLSNEEVTTNYLEPMVALEAKYFGDVFIYMTGHADGRGLEGTLHINTQQIRSWCIAHNKRLFDFYDIECYDPAGTYYGDSDPKKNWALDWQVANPGKWYECYAAHSEPLNANESTGVACQYRRFYR